VKTIFNLVLVGLGWLACLPSTCMGDEADVDGIMAIQPIAAETCVAVAVPLEEGQAVSGLRWYNNDEDTVFPQILAVAGIWGSPPNLDDAVVILQNVSGLENNWSELAFPESVCSPTDLFYVVFQYPASEQVTARGVGPGVGFTTADLEQKVYLSSEGVNWLEMASSKKLLVEPIVAEIGDKANGNVLPLPMPTPTEEDEPDVEVEQEVVAKTQLISAFPNPFNPVTKIRYAMKEAGPVEIGIFDVRGRRVHHTQLDRQPQGYHELVWQGQDENGQRVASGVYLVKMKTGGYEGHQRVVLLK
jgi:hypothetical protein